MNVEIGSIMKYCYDAKPMQTYVDRLPQGFEVPCLYFPPPQTTDLPDTVSTYRITYRLYAKVFDQSAQAAYEMAESIATAIRRKRRIIPLVNATGIRTGEHMRIDKCEVRRLTEDIVYGVAQLFIQWDSRYPFDREVYSKMRNFYLSERVKE